MSNLSKVFKNNQKLSKVIETFRKLPKKAGKQSKIFKEFRSSAAGTLGATVKMEVIQFDIILS